MSGLELGTLRISAQRSIAALVCEELNLMTTSLDEIKHKKIATQWKAKLFNVSMAAAELDAVWHSYVLLMNSFEGVEVLSAAGWTETWQKRRAGCVRGWLHCATNYYCQLFCFIWSADKSFETESISTGLFNSITPVFVLQLFCVAGHRGI